jgi:pimeloyl-ACP methyl ester carboxylesterase
MDAWLRMFDHSWAEKTAEPTGGPAPLGLELLKALPKAASTKPPLLFLHGAFSGAWVWAEHFLPYFAGRGFSAYALSFRGHGRSPGRHDLSRFSLNDFVDDARETISALERPPVLIGHSMGGMVAQRCLGREKLAGLVLMSSVPPAGALGPNTRLAMRDPELWLEFLNLASFAGRRTSPPRIRKMLLSDDLPLHQMDAYLARMQPESERALSDLQVPSVWLGAGFYGVPTLVTGRAGDSLIPRSVLSETAWFHSAELQILPGDAHATMLERRWQESAHVLCDWLERRFG